VAALSKSQIRRVAHDIEKSQTAETFVSFVLFVVKNLSQENCQ